MINGNKNKKNNKELKNNEYKKLNDEQEMILIDILLYYKDLSKQFPDDHCLQENINKIESYLSQ